MTIRERVIELLVSNGMFAGQAEEVLVALQADPSNAAMDGRWNDDAEGYPPQLWPVLQMVARRAALTYIDEKVPLAWFRPMFTDDPEAEIARLTEEREENL